MMARGTVQSSTAAADMKATPMARATKAARRAPAALPAPFSNATRTVAACPMPSGTMKVKAAQLSTIWLAPSAAAPNSPTSTPAVRKTPFSSATMPPIGAPSRTMRPISLQSRLAMLRKTRSALRFGTQLDVKHEAEQHQPLADGAGVARSFDPERRKAEVAVDQYPVQRRIGGNAEQQHDHHRPRARERSEQAAQGSEGEERGRTPGDRAQKTRNLGRQRRVVSEHDQQTIEERDRQHERQRHQQGDDQAFTGDPSGAGCVPPPGCMRGERRDRRDDGLQGDGGGEVERRAESGGSERHGAKPADHHGVGKPHRHLRDARAGERRGNGRGRANFFPDAGRLGHSGSQLADGDSGQRAALSSLSPCGRVVEASNAKPRPGEGLSS